MEYTDKIIAALIASAVSLTVALITYKTAFRRFKEERLNLEKEIEHRYIDKLYEKRIALYPAAFELAGRINKQRKPLGINPSDELSDVRRQLIEWAEGEAGLFMSKDLVDAYYNFTDCLGKNPAKGEFFLPEQIENIWKARNLFRSCLRQDIGILHTSFYKNRS